MVVANGTVDLVALKARHALGDAVEAAGVQLRGRGRVRQGVCPFHDEAEASFTVYSDSERYFCFGCGEGGDVLDFIQRVEGLTLPEAIRRLDGSPGLAPGAVRRPAATRRPSAAVVPPRDPALLTAAVRFYAVRLRRSHAAREYLASRGVGLEAAVRLGLGYAPGSGLREALESCGFAAGRLRDSGLFMDRGSERFAGMAVVPEVAGGLVRWLAGRAIGPDAAPRFQSLPGPKPVLGLGRLGPAPSWAPRAWRRSPPPCGAATASSSPSTPTTRAGRLRSGLAACLDAGPQPYIFPKAWATLPSLLRCHTDAPPSCVCSQGRRTPPGSSPRGFPARFPAPPHRFLYRALGPLFTHPQRTTREDLCPMNDGACPSA